MTDIEKERLNRCYKWFLLCSYTIVCVSQITIVLYEHRSVVEELKQAIFP